MLKLFKKSWVFMFTRLNAASRQFRPWRNYLIGFTAIFVIGFTVGHIFGADIVSGFRDVLDEVGLSVFTTSILPSYTVGEFNTKNPVNNSETQNQQDNNENQNNNQNFSDADSAYIGTGGPVPELMVQRDKQEILDDIAEQLDIIAQQVLLLQQQKNSKSHLIPQNYSEAVLILNPKQISNPNDQSSKNTVEIANVPVVTPVVVVQQNNQNNGGGGGGGSAPVVYPKILISEIQAMGLADSKEEFVELYNPNNSEIDLTGWYLQRKTATGDSYLTFASHILFSGKKIAAGAYFIVARAGYFSSAADMATDNPITDDNFFALKNPNGDISDKLGFGQAQDYETAPAINPLAGQSIGRKVLSNNTEQDTDNNLADFELQIPTPKAQNITFIEPPLPPAPTDVTPPTVNFTLALTQNNLNFIIDFTITDPITTVSPSGIDSYIFRWKEEIGDWQEDARQEIVGDPMSHNLTRDFIGENGKTYYFQVKAKDSAGNESGWLSAEPISTKIDLPIIVEAKPILISEVQIEGQTVKEDFIKFYNPNDFDIFLKDYRLVKRAKNSADDTTIKSWGQDNDAKILAKQYYLWASSTDENYPQTVSADSFTKQNISDNNGIAIRKGEENTGEIIDAVGWGDFNNILFEGLSFPTNPGKNQKLIRKIIEGNYQDTDNNFNDFEILIPETEQ